VGILSEQPEIHNKTFSQVSDERIKAAKQLGAFFEGFLREDRLLKIC